MKSKTNIQAATFAFIAALRGKKIKPALVCEFTAAIKLLMQEKEFNFNNFLELTNPNPALIEIFFSWIDTVKEQKLVKQHYRNWNFPTWQIT